MHHEERPPVRIVREPDLRRLAEATRAVLAEFDRLRELVGHRPDVLAHLYAGRAVRADDDHGRALGLVVQADELRWSELDQLVRLAEAALDGDRHGGVGTWHPRCADCEAVLAMARIRSRHRYRTVGPATPADLPASGGPGGARGAGGAGGPGGPDRAGGPGGPCRPGGSRLSGPGPPVPG